MPLAEALATLGYNSIEDFIAAISLMSEDDRNAEVRRLGHLVDHDSQ